jgi:hypothetical protein
VSHRTAKYAIELLEQDDTLPSGARKVFMAMSIRANVRTSATMTGEWLCRATGLVPANVTRALNVLVDRGYIVLRHRPGKASIVTFPIAGYLADTAGETGGRTDDQGQFHPFFCACLWCQEQTG